MKVPTLVMAGGKGSRMGLATEKPMLLFLDKPLIEWVINAILESNEVSEFYVVTSPNTPQTEEYCRSRGWKVLRTEAKGYHNDVKQAVSQLNWMGPVLTIPADVPAITGKVLDKVIKKFEKCGKDFFAVFVPIEARKKMGLSVSSVDEYKGIWYAVSGVNIINGKKTLSEGKVETDAIVSEDIEVILNVNTVKDLEVAQKIVKKS